MSNYLDQFPPEYRTYVRNKFYTAYVFEEQSYDFGTDDRIQLAKGPKEMKARLAGNLEELLALGPTPEQVGVIEQMLKTLDKADTFIVEVKKEIDSIWRQARDYHKLHPRKDKYKAEPPSEKQLSYLKSLGCPDIPKTKKEAHRLIDEYKSI